MDWKTTPFAFYLSSISLVLAAVICFKTSKLHNKKPYHWAFFLTAATTVVWNASVLIAYLFYRNRMPQFVGMSFIGIIITPPALFLTAWYYANPDKPFRLRHLSVFLLPLFSALVAFTNQEHHLLLVNHSFYHKENTYGPYFAIHALYSFTLVFIALYLFFSFTRKSAGFISRQTKILLLGFSIPIIENLVITMQILPTNMLHNSIGFTISMVAVWYAIVAYDFLDVTPLAFHTVMDHISNGILILSRKNQIVNYNKYLLQMLGIKQVKENEWNIFDYTKRLGISRTTVIEAIMRAIKEQRTISAVRRFTSDSIDKYLEVQITPLFSGREHRGTVILLNDITELKKAIEELTHKNKEIEILNQQLKNLAETDSLTGAYNRRFFDEYYKIEAQRALSRNRFTNNPHASPDFGLAIIDIDNFKKINDSWGHLAGDEVLRTLVELIKANIFGRDVVCRYGGEEFAVIFTNTNEEGLTLAAEKIRIKIAETPFRIGSQEEPLYITVSIGIAFFDREYTEETLTELIAIADERLYCAKRTGKNRVIGRVAQS
ncbi:MAG: diguanylate cyclase [Spirochaetales bacterium]|nr:diguanylate cyclase [Spirochaetales bacterium]